MWVKACIGDGFFWIIRKEHERLHVEHGELEVGFAEAGWYSGMWREDNTSSKGIVVNRHRELRCLTQLAKSWSSC